jgi:hypothetical protein
MRQLTIRGFDAETSQRIREVARRDGISLNKAALRLLRRGAGTDTDKAPADVVGDSLDRFIGTMTAAQERALLASIKDCEQVDPTMWR